MPTLDWIGKKAVVNHHREVPYRLIHCDGELSAGDSDAGNLYLHGDNLEALKALLPYYGGQVKCIYIDPPYNTGQEGWIYNDNVNNPEIKSWLGKVVGKEAEDLSRHDKWLCMMYPRLRLLRDFLTEDGVFFMSIDGNEIHHAKMLLDDIFGPNSHKNTISVRRGIKSVQSQFEDIDRLSQGHEYILFYSKNAKLRLPKLTIGTDEEKPGKWDTFWRGTDRHTMRYELFGNDTPETGQWRWEKNRAKRAIANYKEYLASHAADMTLDEWFLDNLTSTNVKLDFVRHSDDGVPQYYVPPRSGKLSSDNWMDILLSGSATKFETEKNAKIIARIVQWVTDDGDIILDSFSGSGTTAQSVIETNRLDGKNRNFILIEMLDTVAEGIAIPRLTTLVEGNSGEGFRYCRLGAPLFNEFGDIDTAVSFPDLAAHIFFSETGAPIPAKADGASTYIGKYGEKAVYLLFASGQEGMPREAMGNVLTPDMLACLPNPPADFEGQRIVYGEGCTVGKERLAESGVTFKQIPYQIEGV